MDDPKIKKLRKIVDQTDEKIIRLLEKRFFLTGKIQKIKERNNLPVDDLNRETEIVCEILKNKTNVPTGCIEDIFKTLFKYAKKGKSKKIACN